jgi:hypothetical protein
MLCAGERPQRTALSVKGFGVAVSLPFALK